ncbi:Protein of unknown function DUF1288 [Sulfolobus islandicus Y.G.57.14]|uniref:GINS subunit domain-containing protein n=10 Tax=Saccharolobus islandicus TaxID=43080 RepID=C3MQ08_SACI2|nr:hypothetical protein [Sulfolobus islandicus]ACP35471.1 Protein of unknown function DUF1288 [Sulfolobus islandicus L.S.2.15]ACP38122.1 Protein of unknown function DUF1288 [Sulfolobus islandicus M.14.25]ACP45629.1 Protein of unknown function DUF1288 [Sulfolobus islandicus Y.G.57.14]ACP48569.1 Protein of unknown function DUF1288 [Sulfolobus islandicus Y.N.15.51]ACP55301.1 Protein of unknown function DUF1288 [Sulfolobus islandicus M.16.27]
MIEVKLRAIKRLSNTYIRRVMIIEDWNGSSITAGNVELIKGSENQLPQWLAIILEEKNVAKIEDRISIEDLGRILFQERQNANTPASLVPLGKDFSSRVQLYLETLKRDKNVESLEKLRKSISILNEIIKIRLRKLIQLAFLNIDDQNLINGMTEEELLIYKTIKQLIKELYGDIIGNS